VCAWAYVYYLFVCVFVCVRACVRVSVCTCVCIYIYIYICVCVCVCVSVSGRMCASIILIDSMSVQGSERIVATITVWSGVSLRE